MTRTADSTALTFTLQRAGLQVQQVSTEAASVCRVARKDMKFDGTTKLPSETTKAPTKLGHGNLHLRGSS